MVLQLRVVLLQVLLFFVGFSGWAQSSLHYSVGHFQSVDQLLIPTRFGGYGLGVDFDRMWLKNRNQLQLTVGFDLGVERNQLKYYAIMLNQSTSLAYRFRVTNEFKLGPKWESASWAHYYVGLDDGHLYWIKQHFVGVSGSFTFLIKERLFRTKLESNLLGWYSRPEYQNYESNWRIKKYYHYMNSNLRFGTLFTMPNAKISLTYHSGANSHWTYSLFFIRVNHPERSALIQNQLTYAVRLGKRL